MDQQPGRGVRPKKRWRDRLIARCQRRPDWLLGFEDEVWFSRVSQPDLSAWTDGEPLRLVEQTKPKKTKVPGTRKALACYGLLARFHDHTGTPQEQVWLRFVDGRPVSAVTTAFLAWVAEQAAALGKRVLALVWDNASWHVSAQVRAWLRQFNQHAKATGGVRLLVCPLPSKSPWLNPIEPKWVHGKRAVLAPDRCLSPAELQDRLCAYYQCDSFPQLIAPNEPP